MNIEQHYRENYDGLVRRIYFRLGSLPRDVAEDVVQEAYEEAYRYRAGYNPDIKDFDSWFNTILNNTFRRVQKHERDRGISRTLDETDIIDEKPYRIDLNECLSLMANKRDKEIVRLFLGIGMKAKDIAEHMKIEHNLVRKVVSTFYKRLGNNNAFT